MPSNLVNVVGFDDFERDMQDRAAAYGRMGQPTYVVGSNVPYALFQELGTYAMAAQPHVRPATMATAQRMGEFAARADNLDQYLLLAAQHLEAGIKRRAPVDTGKLRASYGPPVKL